MRAPKESAASEVLNIVSGPGIQVTADVLCSENGSSIACSRPHLGVLDLGLGVQSEAVSSDTKGNTKEMKAGGKVYCPLYFPSLLLTAVTLPRILIIFCCVPKISAGVSKSSKNGVFYKSSYLRFDFFISMQN